MSLDRFINERKNNWERLEDLLRLLDHASLRRLHREEVRELGRIYRRTASDLAIARAESRDPRLVNYLNSLVIRAHGRIYQADPQGSARILRFFTHGFPQTFRRTWRYTAVSFITFTLFAVIGFGGTAYDAEFSDLVGVPTDFKEHVIEAKIHWWETINDKNEIASSAIMTNNIRVTFMTFAFGALLGVGTIYILASNGAMIFSVVALTYKAGFSRDLLTFMAGHGVIELSCIFIAGGAGLMIGKAMLIPGDLTRAEAIKKHGLEAILLILGIAPLLVIAGTIEGFISPADISPMIKYGIAVITGLAMYSYLLFAGREWDGKGQ